MRHTFRKIIFSILILCFVCNWGAFNNPAKRETNSSLYGKEGANKFYSKSISETTIHANDLEALNEERHPQTNNDKMQYGVLLKSGKMMTVSNGYLSVMKFAATMNDGTKATIEGFIVKGNGAKIKMKEGDYIDVSGDFIVSRTSISK